jgi:predicted peptidase
LRKIQKYICFGIFLFLLWNILPQKAAAQEPLKKVKYNYLISLPEGYNKDPLKTWPVIFYLHGSSASGRNLKKIQRYGLPYYLSTGKKLDFIVVSPQCPAGKDWTRDDWFNPLYDEIASKYQIDDCRIYLVGMSMGGFGTWALANRMPNRFAAISPMCGGGQVKWAENLSNIPIWVFHSSDDSIVPVTRSEEMVNALKTKNKLLRFTRLIKHGHDISDEFNNDALYAWLKQFSLKRLAFWQEPLPFIKSIANVKVKEYPSLVVQDLAYN